MIYLIFISVTKNGQPTDNILYDVVDAREKLITERAAEALVTELNKVPGLAARAWTDNRWVNRGPDEFTRAYINRLLGGRNDP